MPKMTLVVVVVVVIVTGVVMFIGSRSEPATESAASANTPSPETCFKHPSYTGCPPPPQAPKPLTATERRAREKAYAEGLRLQKQAEAEIRKEWAAAMEKELLLKGLECRLEARGTTLYFEYVFVGRSLAAQLDRDFVRPKAKELHDLGFTKFLASDGSGQTWTWQL